MSRGLLLTTPPPSDYLRLNMPSLDANSYPSLTKKFSNFAALSWNYTGYLASRLEACASKISVIESGSLLNNFYVPLVSGLLLRVNSDASAPAYIGRFFEELARELTASLLLCWSAISGSVLRSTFTDLATPSLLVAPLFCAAVGLLT